MSPLISVIVPVYNGRRYLDAALASVQAQTYQPLEVIVVDDGSTDDSVARLAAIADPRLEIVTQPNAGLSNTLNRGLARARGRWVKFVPSDDVLEPDCIARQLAAAERAPGARLVFALPTVVDADGAPCPDPAPQAWFDHAPEGRDEILRDMLERNFLCAPAVLFDRDHTITVDDPPYNGDPALVRPMPGAVRAVATITTGLGWKLAQPVLEVTGAPDAAALDAAWELGASLAALLATEVA